MLSTKEFKSLSYRAHLSIVNGIKAGLSDACKQEICDNINACIDHGELVTPDNLIHVIVAMSCVKSIDGVKKTYVKGATSLRSMLKNNGLELEGIVSREIVAVIGKNPDEKKPSKPRKSLSAENEELKAQVAQLIKIAQENGLNLENVA